MSTAQLITVRRAYLSQDKKVRTVTWAGNTLPAFLAAAGVTPKSGEVLAVDGEVVLEENLEGTEVPAESTVTAIKPIAGG